MTASLRVNPNLAFLLIMCDLYVKIKLHLQLPLMSLSPERGRT
jgi:hypothetical protein